MHSPSLSLYSLPLLFLSRDGRPWCRLRQQSSHLPLRSTTPLSLFFFLLPLSLPPLAAVDGHVAACSRIHRRRCLQPHPIAAAAARCALVRSLFPFFFSFRSLFFSFPRLSCRSFSSSSLAFVRVRVPARGACSAHSAASAALTQPAALRDRSAATIARPLCDLVAPFSGRPLARPSSSPIDPLLVMFAHPSTPRVPPSMCLLGRCACDQQQPHQRRPASRLRFAQGP